MAALYKVRAVTGAVQCLLAATSRDVSPNSTLWACVMAAKVLPGLRAGLCFLWADGGGGWCVWGGDTAPSD